MKPYYETRLGKLYLGDCTEILPRIDPVDLVITDPPYGIGMCKGFSNSCGILAKTRQYNDNWDNMRPSNKCFEQIIKSAKNIMIFGGNFFADQLPPSTHWLVWDKKNTMPSYSDAELIWTNIKQKSVKIYTWQYNGFVGGERERLHPTQKPLGLIKKIIIDYIKNEQVVGDWFFGSGTTGVSCEYLNYKWIGIEKLEKYCEIAAKRIEEENMQARLF